ncbi:MAG TPA: protease complex subunit PrcB family protein [Gemmatimonadaceae bacterium]
MRHRSSLCSLLLAGVVVMACSNATDIFDLARIPRGAEPVATTPADSMFSHTVYSGIVDRVRTVIRDSSDWQGMWDRMVGSQSPAPPVPDVDFPQYMIVLAAMGTKPTGGYAISIDGVYRSGSYLYASVTETSPGRNCVVTEAQTAPVDAVLVPRSDAPIIFVEETAVHECS